jgi:hypothetical protein
LTIGQPGLAAAHTFAWLAAAWRGLLRATAVALLATLMGPGAALAETWTVTIVEGDASVLEGTQRQAAKPGQRLAAGAIIETNARLALLRLEGGDQLSIDLGPDTKAMVLPPGMQVRGKPAQLYLLQGWAKLTSRSTAANGASLPVALTPGLALGPSTGALVLQALRREQVAFAESGRIELSERRTGGATHVLEAGRELALDANRRGTIRPRPQAEWLAKVPRSFRDAVPLRLAAVKDRRVDSTPLPAPDYAALSDWLSAEPEIRRAFPQRFGALAREPEFRRQLQAQMAQHPEWNPILNPPPRAP